MIEPQTKIYEPPIHYNSSKGYGFFENVFSRPDYNPEVRFDLKDVFTGIL